MIPFNQNQKCLILGKEWKMPDGWEYHLDSYGRVVGDMKIAASAQHIVNIHHWGLKWRPRVRD